MNKPSTVFELIGFALLTAMGWMLTPVAGLGVAGLSALVIGFSFEDERSVVALRNVTFTLGVRRAARKQKRAARRARRSQRGGFRVSAEVLRQKAS